MKMTCYTADIIGEPKPDNEIERVVWLHYADINDVSPVDQIIFDDLYNKRLIR